jgi:protein-serine/threonine kinase
MPAHASLPQLYASFSVRTHHVLVLEYVAGGELLDVVNSDEQHAQLSEKLLQRIWCELVGAVEWIHARFVVHRDIKLESASAPSSGTTYI